MNTDLDELRAAYPDAAKHIHKLPPNMHGGVARWVTRGIRPGAFLSAVIVNDLRGAVWAADDTNLDILADYVKFFHNHAPHQCWGSYDQASGWIKRGGLLGHPEEAA